MVFHVFVFIVF